MLYFNSILSGILLALSIPPFNLDFLCWFALVPLYILIYKSGYKNLIFAGYAAGLIFFGSFLYSAITYNIWIYFLLILTLPFLFAAQLVIAKYFFLYYKSPFLRLIIPPCIWLTLEYLCSLIYISLHLGNILFRHPVLIQIADITGIWGISFLIIFINNGISLLYAGLEKRKAGIADIKSIPHILILTAVFFSNIIYGNHSLEQKREVEGPGLKTALVQGNISFDNYDYNYDYPDIAQSNIQTYFQLTTNAMSGRPDLIIWPEIANLQYNFRVPYLRSMIYALAKKSTSYLLIGSCDIDEYDRKLNTIFLVSPAGSLIGKYVKVRTVPYFERDKTPAKSVHIINSPIGNIGAMICFETAFPDISRKLVNNGADFLFGLVNNTGMKKSPIPFLHSATAVFRAIENRKYFVFINNSGISRIINPDGQTVRESKPFERTILYQRIFKTRIESFYTKYGDIFSFFCIFFIMVLFILIIYRKMIKRNID